MFRNPLCPKDGGDEGQSFFVQERLESGHVEPKLTVRRDSQVEEELRLTQEKLELKEKEVTFGRVHSKLKYIHTVRVLVVPEVTDKKYYSYVLCKNNSRALKKTYLCVSFNLHLSTWMNNSPYRVQHHQIITVN